MKSKILLSGIVALNLLGVTQILAEEKALEGVEVTSEQRKDDVSY